MVTGTGTSGDPFVLSTFSDLELIGTTGYALSAYYKLGANIDAAATADPGYNSGAGWLPRGDTTTAFTGGFDGDNKTISNLYINRSSTNYVGLFGYTNTSTSANNIKNFTLSNPDITGQNYVGAVFGQQGGDATGITVSGGTIDGASYVGGICGQTTSSATGITYCTVSNNTAITNTGDYTGGIIGYGNPACNNNSVTATISGTQYVGGIIGALAGGMTITYCTVNATISGTNIVGGIFGYKSGSNAATILNNCTVNIDITNSGNNTGGIAGYQGGYNQNTNVDGTNCTITGTITASGTYVGGVCGTAISLVQNFTITSALTFSVSGCDYVGGIVGYIPNPVCTTVKNCVVKTDIAGRDYVGGIVGGSPNSNVCSIVYQNAYNGTISGRDYVGGIFGSNLGTNGSNSLYKCYSNGTVTASGTGAGGLIGRQGNYGISNCYSTATVSAPNGTAGGLIGRCNSNSPTFSYCYSKGAVSGSTAGGLTGYGTPTATNCYWDTQTSGQATSTIGTGKTTAEMNTQDTFVNWDFTNNWNIGALNSGYPYLKAVALLSTSVEVTPTCGTATLNTLTDSIAIGYNPTLDAGIITLDDLSHTLVVGSNLSAPIGVLTLNSLDQEVSISKNILLQISNISNINFSTFDFGISTGSSIESIPSSINLNNQEQNISCGCSITSPIGSLNLDSLDYDISTSSNLLLDLNPLDMSTLYHNISLSPSINVTTTPEIILNTNSCEYNISTQLNPESGILSLNTLAHLPSISLIVEGITQSLSLNNPNVDIKISPNIDVPNLTAINLNSLEQSVRAIITQYLESFNFNGVIEFRKSYNPSVDDYAFKEPTIIVSSVKDSVVNIQFVRDGKIISDNNYEVKL